MSRSGQEGSPYLPLGRAMKGCMCCADRKCERMLSQRSHVSPVTRYIDTRGVTVLAHELSSEPGLSEYSI